MERPITISITRHVAPERVREANAWARAGQDLIASYPGYLGSGWIRSDADGPEWHMLFRFTDSENLARWERSPERAWWVASANGIVHDTERRTGIEGWFDRPETVEAIGDDPPEALPAPPRWKQMVSIFVGFFPVNVIAQYALAPVTHDWPLVLRALLTIVCVMPVMVYLVLPAVTRALRPWLLAPSRRAPQRT
ncbi:antibiotic biosynthesis monooxygenase [Frigoribacterium sp. 2-23]|uniref:antibiotic biosynthesis monooxygenase n=1 Tax=Frigoribacterium sp. 2-23 TaxID=3415006 RepID=UPI003C6F66A8